MAGGRELVAKLPWVVLAKANGVGVENLRLQERYARIVFFPHPGLDARCAAFVGELAGAARELADWDARTIVVVAAGAERTGAELQEAARGVTVLVDRAGADGARARAGVPPRSAALLIADRFGDVWHGYDAGESEAFPEARELEAWLRYLATQCPE